VLPEGESDRLPDHNPINNPFAMAKDKKRGFFSWFGRGRQEEEQQKEEIREEPPVAEALRSDTPAQEAPPAPEESHEQAAAELAEEIVHITEQVAAQPVAETPVVAEVVTEEPVLVEEQVVEDEFVESAAEIAEDAREDSLDAVDDSLVVEDHVAEEEPVEDAPLPVALDPIVVLPAGETEQERPTKEGFFARLKRSLVKTKQNLGSGFVGLFRGKKIDDDLFEELEEQLLIADVGVETTRKIITSLTEHASRKQLKDADALYGKLKEEMSEILAKVDEPLDVSDHHR